MVFFVLTHPRSGSHLLGDLFRSHPDITFLSEPFKYIDKQSVFLDMIEDQGKDSKAVGADIKYGWVDQLIPHMEAELPHYKLIHLIRKDVLRTAVSNLLACTTKEPPIHIEIKDFLLMKALIESSIKHIRTIFKCHEVFYEDITGGGIQTQTFLNQVKRKRMLEYLDLPDFELTSNRKKEHPGDLSNWVINHEELENV